MSGEIGITELKCAEKILEVTPRVMNQIRTHMRDIAQNSAIELTVPQFRILNRLNKYSTNYSELAAWIGVSLPGISRMMEGLVLRGLVERDRSSVDRRHVGLRLSERGKKIVQETRLQAQLRFAEKFRNLPEDVCAEMLSALETLDRILFKIENKASYQNGVPVISEPRGATL
jgi:DNA-binding MarR family transcriptional regulator